MNNISPDSLFCSTRQRICILLQHMDTASTFPILKYLYRIMHLCSLHNRGIYWFNRLRPCIRVGVYGDSGVGKTQFLQSCQHRCSACFLLRRDNGKYQPDIYSPADFSTVFFCLLFSYQSNEKGQTHIQKLQFHKCINI